MEEFSMKSRYAKEIIVQTTTQRIYPNQNFNFAKCFNWLMRRRELTPGAKLVYTRFTQYAGVKNYARVKQATLALEIGLSLRQVKRYIAELAHFHLIEIHQVGLNKANLYYFLEHPWMIQTNQSSIQKQPHLTVETEDIENMEVTYVSLPERSDLTLQEVPHMTCQEVPDLTLPLNRSSEKISLKEHTQKKERVCVPNSPVSAYSKQEWLRYAESQRNIDCPEALADKLARSKENDHLMRKFLESQKQQSQKLELQQQNQKQKDLELENQKQTLIANILALPEIDNWHLQLLQQFGYSLEQIRQQQAKLLASKPAASPTHVAAEKIVGSLLLT